MLTSKSTIRPLDVPWYRTNVNCCQSCGRLRRSSLAAHGTPCPSGGSELRQHERRRTVSEDGAAPLYRLYLDLHGCRQRRVETLMPIETQWNLLGCSQLP